MTNFNTAFTFRHPDGSRWEFSFAIGEGNLQSMPSPGHRYFKVQPVSENAMSEVKDILVTVGGGEDVDENISVFEGVNIVAPQLAAAHFFLSQGTGNRVELHEGFDADYTLVLFPERNPMDSHTTERYKNARGGMLMEFIEGKDEEGKPVMKVATTLFNVIGYMNPKSLAGDALALAELALWAMEQTVMDHAR